MNLIYHSKNIKINYIYFFIMKFTHLYFINFLINNKLNLNKYYLLIVVFY